MNIHRRSDDRNKADLLSPSILAGLTESWIRCVASLLGIVVIGAPAASAQERIYKWFGDQSQEAFGNSLTKIGDVTGDGVPDVIIGAPSASTDFGMLRAFSGSDGSIAWSLFGSSGETLGLAVTAVGDLDQDGIDDFIATSANPPLGNPSGWGVTAYSGATQLRLYSVLGDANERLGKSIVTMGDVDGDGVTDYAVSERFISDVHVISGRTGVLVYLIPPTSDAYYFAYAIASGGDFDGDGVQDLVIGDPNASPGGKATGAAWVYSGKSGRLLYEIPGVVKSSDFGSSVAIVHDLDQDGVADVLVGAPRNALGGHARLYSGITGAFIMDVTLRFPQSSYMGFGSVVADAGDLNHDGYGDFFVTQAVGGEIDDPNNALSEVHLFSGRDGGQMYHYYDDESGVQGFGAVVQLAPDLDGDGNPEVAISYPSDDNASLANPGSVSVLRADDLFVDAVPRIATSGVGQVSLTVGQGIASSPYVLFLVDLNGSPATVLLTAGLLDATGRAALSGQAPPNLQGYDFGFKAFTLDASSKIIDSGVETMYFQ